MNELKETNVSHWKKQSILLFIVALAATAYDAYSSWRIIAVDQIATEANGVWNEVAHVVGFDGAMIIRFIFGALLLSILLFVSLKSKKIRTKRLARIGLYVTGAVLILLCSYHVYGTLMTNLILNS